MKYGYSITPTNGNAYFFKLLEKRGGEWRPARNTKPEPITSLDSETIEAAYSKLEAITLNKSN